MRPRNLSTLHGPSERVDDLEPISDQGRRPLNTAEGLPSLEGAQCSAPPTRVEGFQEDTLPKAKYKKGKQGKTVKVPAGKKTDHDLGSASLTPPLTIGEIHAAKLRLSNVAEASTSKGRLVGPSTSS